MNKVFLACYRGRGDKLTHRLYDGITRFFTRGKYSHTEIAIALPDGRYQCYSSSVREVGVRTKVMSLPSDKWDLIALDGVSATQIKRYFAKTMGAGYDLLGALGCVAGLPQNTDKFFCSEWCYNAIFGSNQGFWFSPNQLAEIVRHLSILDN